MATKRLSGLNPNSGIEKRPEGISFIPDEHSSLLALKRILANGGTNPKDFSVVFGGAQSREYLAIPREALGDSWATSIWSIMTPEEFDRLIEIMRRRVPYAVRRSRYLKLEIPTAECVRDFLFDIKPLEQVVHDNIKVDKTYESFLISEENRFILYKVLYDTELRARSPEHLAVANRLREDFKRAQKAEADALKKMMTGGVRATRKPGEKLRDVLERAELV